VIAVVAHAEVEQGEFQMTPKGTTETRADRVLVDFPSHRNKSFACLAIDKSCSQDQKETLVTALTTFYLFRL